MNVSPTQIENQFFKSLTAYEEAFSFSKPERLKRLLSQVNVLVQRAEGLQLLYENIPRLLEAGIFEKTAWEHPHLLVPGLVSGTLLAPEPTSTLEVMSELRLLAIVEGKVQVPDFSPEAASQFLEDVLVKNFELAYNDFSAPVWQTYAGRDLLKIKYLFALILSKIPLQQLKPQILDELRTYAAYRPIVNSKVEHLLKVVGERMPLDVKTSKTDRDIKAYVDAFLAPTPHAKMAESIESYQQSLPQLTRAELQTEAQLMGQQMKTHWLVSRQQLFLLHYLAQEHPDLVADALALDAHGKAEYEKHQAFVCMLIPTFLTPAMKQAVYGLSRILERNLLSRKTTFSALNRLLRIRLHPSVAARLEKTNTSGEAASPIQLLASGVFCVLGHPLGVRQGNNPTCQSARGISMWSRNAPAKLLNLLMDAAVADNLHMRFEGQLLESVRTGIGLVERLDYKLDPVSVVLVPHLDKIYNEMMKRASLHHLGVDSHVSVNPAFYGHWIQTGFGSVFNPMTQEVENYRDFVRIFYAAYHPEFNGGHHIVYPVPLGIFITDTAARMRGYHAISLMRVAQWKGEWRAYFFNPNAEGRQNWGQGILPSVIDQGEKFGESSLPFGQFVSRVYAFHYNQLRMDERDKLVPEELVTEVEKLAKTSWGVNYKWKQA